MFIATLSNTTDEYGYIVIGASKNTDKYSINGISAGFKIDEPIKRALGLLSEQPKIDFGFINLPFEDDLLSITTCCEVHDILIGGIEYKQLSYTGASYAELSLYPLVMLERKSISRLCIDDFFEKAGISLSPVLELGSLDLIISFVRNNMGLNIPDKNEHLDRAS